MSDWIDTLLLGGYDRVKECEFYFFETNLHQNLISAFLFKAARLGNSQWDDGL